jgi:hypothetical protein
MPDNLKIEVAVDVGPVDQLGASAKNLAGSISTLAAQFVASGLSAKEAASALQNLGYSAAQAAAATKNLASAEEMVGAAAAVTTAKVDAMTRALGMGATRIAASEAGMGQLGFALTRVTSASPALAAALQYAFAPLIAVALISEIEKVYQKLRSVEMESLTFAENWQKIDHAGASALHSIDLELDRTDVKIVELTQGKLAAMNLELRQIGDGAIEMAGHVESLFDAIGAQLEKEEPILDKFREFFTFAQTGLMIPNMGEITKSVGAEISRSLDEKGLGKTIDLVNEKIAKVNQTLASGPKDEALEKYAAALMKVLGLLEARQRLEDKQKEEKGLAIGKEAETEAEKAEAANASYLRSMADRDLEMANRARAAADRQEKLDEEIAADTLRMAKKDLADFEKVQREKAESYVHIWAQAAREQEEAFRDNQKKSELGMRDVSAKTSFDTAGLGAGPIKNVLESASIQAQTQIAAKALTDAKNAAASYNLELAALAAAQSKIDVSSTEGAREYQSLQNELDKLRRQYDQANEATEKWLNTLQKLAAEQKALSPNIFQGLATSAQNAAQSGFQAFNSAFIKMAEGGMSFTRLMQTAWTSMATSFITSVLQMGEKWIVQHVLMAAAQKLMDALGLSTHLASISGQIAANKALALSQAGLAGAGGVASMAAAPFPIDLTAPAFGAAMQGAAASFALFERGGIVPAGLHEGEMVLPKHISTFVQTAAAGASGKGTSAVGMTGSGRPIHLHNHTTVNTLNGDGIEDVLAAHGDRMFDFFKGKVRRMGQNI